MTFCNYKLNIFIKLLYKCINNFFNLSENFQMVFKFQVQFTASEETFAKISKIKISKIKL